MPTANLTITGDIAGIGLNASLVRAADGQIGHAAALPTAKSGSITAYSAGPPASWTVNVPGHGLSTGDHVDVYIGSSVAFGLKVIGVNNDDLTLEASDVQPSDTTAMPTTGLPVSCLVGQVVEIDTDFDADLLVAIGALADKVGHLVFAPSTGTTEILAVNLPAKELWSWFSGGTASNPFGTGNTVGRVLASTGDAAGTTLKLGILYDSTV